MIHYVAYKAQKTRCGLVPLMGQNTNHWASVTCPKCLRSFT